MCDENNNQGVLIDITRRTFGAAGAAAAGLTATGALAQARVVERDVNVSTPHGTADSVLFYPEGAGRWPAALVWTDIMSLRPSYREIGRRLAAEGFVVLVPNVYYRKAKAPVVQPGFNFGTPEGRAQITPLREGLNENVESDATAYFAFLDAQSQTDTRKKAGVQGHCMGGPYTFRTAAHLPNRIGAAASFHGGGLNTNAANSPHLLIPRMTAEVLVAIARNDDASQPTSKDILKQAFAAANRPAKVEVYAADHGWTASDSAVYNKAEADRAFAEQLAIYKRNLV